MNQERMHTKLKLINRTKMHYEYTLITLQEIEQATLSIDEQLKISFRITQIQSIIELCNKDISDFKKEHPQYRQKDLFLPAPLLPKL